jgi:hypothetical protein
LWAKVTQARAAVFVAAPATTGIPATSGCTGGTITVPDGDGADGSALQPDGSTVAISDDSTYLWNITTRKRIGVLPLAPQALERAERTTGKTMY